MENLTYNDNETLFEQATGMRSLSNPNRDAKFSLKTRGDMPAFYETFEHEADIGIRGFGGTPEEAFSNAALALYSVMVNIAAVEPKEKKTVTASAPDVELLLVEWLNALLSLSDIERMVFSRFEVTIEGTSLTGTAWGDGLDGDRHEPNVEVKGATYHMLSVKKEDGRYIAQCVVDI